jgi:hypothetical protein
MKKIFTLITIITLAFACSDDDFGGNGTLTGVAFNVNLKFDDVYNNLPVENGTITLTNTNTGDVYTASSTSNGIAFFESILPGIYNITATKTLTSAEFNSKFGYTPDSEEVIFNGNQSQVVVNANITSTNVTLSASRIGDLVIKQIYYAGSHATQGASFRDQFIEIYNNSNQVIYADGLCIGQLYGNTTTTTSSFTQINGQFDWNKSLGMPLGTTNANSHYVYAEYVIKVPGNGTQYPIQPGESIVIAQNAQNHQSPLVRNDGQPINITNPDLTIDLSGSEFEVYLGDWELANGGTLYNFDLQNPAVTDMIIAYWGRQGFFNGNKDFLMDNPGRDSMIIFRSENLDALPNYPAPTILVEDNSTKYYLQIPTNIIIDGVELQHFNTNSQRPKMLPSNIDASEIKCDAAFNSQSVIRKIKSTTPDGRKILQDTNNTSEDFVKLAKANPKGFASN